MTEKALSSADKRFSDRRLAARLAAVQALYQLEYGGGAEAVVREFLRHRLPDEGRLDALDADHFTAIVVQTVEAQERVDEAVSAVLAQGWSLKRIDATVRAILRAGAWELLARPDIPTAAIIDAYVDVADAFFDGDEPRFVNGALDSIARRAPERVAPVAP